ncbi:MAG: hypothetical protein Q9201_006724 [Fulgogasparrea decipioides]
MRFSARLLAAVKPEHFLTPGNPTGLTGLLTHPAPRTQLLYLYSSTLDKLSKLPQHSVYRQSAEAITKHRFSIVDSIKPRGYEEWAQRAQKNVDEHPEVFGKDADVRKTFLPAQLVEYVDELDVEWNGKKMSASDQMWENLRWLIGEQAITLNGGNKDRRGEGTSCTAYEENDWIAEIEDKLGGGLIEEVILVAEGEHKLVDTMLESRSWEELEEKPPNGQWTYFTRDQHTPGTQEPPKGKD